MIDRKVTEKLADFLKQDPVMTEEGEMIHPAAPNGYLVRDKKIVRLATHLGILHDETRRYEKFLLSHSRMPHELVRMISERYRLPLVSSLMDVVSPREAARCLREGFIGGWPGALDTDEILRLFHSTSDFLMTDRERQILAKLPGKITVYRGCRETEGLKPDWALNLDTACRYAGGADCDMCEATVYKDDIIALIRDTKEIIVDPDRLMEICRLDL